MEAPGYNAVHLSCSREADHYEVGHESLRERLERGCSPSLSDPLARVLRVVSMCVCEVLKNKVVIHVLATV